MDKCPYCHVDDGEGHTVTCHVNNQNLKHYEAVRAARDMARADTIRTLEMIVDALKSAKD